MTNSNNLISILKAIPHICHPVDQVTGETLARARVFVEGTPLCLYIIHFSPRLGLWLAMVEVCPGIMQLSYFSNLGLIKFTAKAQSTYLEGSPRPPSFPSLDIEWIERPLSQVFSQINGRKGKRKITPRKIVDKLRNHRTSLYT